MFKNIFKYTNMYKVGLINTLLNDVIRYKKIRNKYLEKLKNNDLEFFNFLNS